MPITAKPKVLFLCTGNSCRSQMAEGFARAILADKLQPYSAGILAHGMNPNAIRVMQEVGIDISQQHSKTVDSLEEETFDTVIAVCDHANASCPKTLRSARTICATFDDPPKLAQAAASEEEALGHYRRVRDEIKNFIESKLINLMSAS